MRKSLLLKLAVFLFMTIGIPVFVIWKINQKQGNESYPSMNDIIICDKTSTGSVSMDLESYLIGVLAVQAPDGYDLEALKAQAVIARTYALKNIESLTQGTLKTKHRKYSVPYMFSTKELGLEYISPSSLTDHSHKSSYEEYMNQIKTAVTSTKNTIITYHNELITPLFFRVGTGVTRDSSDLFSPAIPYLRSVSSDFDIQSPDYLQTPILSMDAVISTLNSAYKNRTLGASSYDLQVYDILPLAPNNFFHSVHILERDAAGYVLSIALGEVVVSGESVAKALSLPSSAFYIEDYDDSVRFVCNGSGHGLGLSQYGAEQLAKNGFSYHEILTYYYTGTKVVTCN